jgi:3-isopropylmalate dehydrogenase
MVDTSVTTPEPTSLNLAVIGGDGIGPEVVGEGLKVLAAVTGGAVSISTTDYDLGARRWHATGETLPDSVLAELRGHDAILLGAIGDPTVPSGVLERGVLLPLRFALDHYVNLRPAKLYPGVASPLDIARVAPERHRLRRRSRGHRGPLCRQRWPPARRHPARGRDRGQRQHPVRRRAGRSRRLRPRPGPPPQAPHAGAQAQRPHPRRPPVAAHRRGGRAEFPEVQTAYQHVDAATIFLATDPGRFDVIVTDNLFGDIITDIAAAIAGGIGLAASGNINPSRSTPSMFEPVHGSAPDIAGQGKADPTAAILSVAMLLDHVGLADAAARVEAAVAADLAERGNQVRSTVAIGDAIAARLA